MAILSAFLRFTTLVIIACIYENQSFSGTDSSDMTSSPAEHDSDSDTTTYVIDRSNPTDRTTANINEEVPTTTACATADVPTKNDPKSGIIANVTDKVSTTDFHTLGTMADINKERTTSDMSQNQTVIPYINKTVAPYIDNATETVTEAGISDNSTTNYTNAGNKTIGNKKVTSETSDTESIEAGECRPYYCCEPFLSTRDRHTLRKKEETMVNVITYFWISLFLCLGGLIGNILSFIVLYRQKVNTSVFFLKCLAVSDGLYMLWYLVFDLYYTAYMYTQWLTNRDDHSSHVIPANKIYLSFGNATLTLYSSWLVVFLTIDRFIIVRVPLKANSLCTLNKARVEAFVLFICCVGFNMPIFWQYTSSIELHPCWDYLIMYKDPTEFGKSYVIVFVYNVVLSVLIVNLIPVFMVFIMNIMLVIGLKQASARRRKLVSDGKEAQKRDESISLMLITVATLYLILLLPSLGLSILRSLWLTKTFLKVEINVDKKHYDAIPYYALSSDLLIRVNSAINFIVYVLVSKKFRDGLIELVCCKKRGPGESYKVNATKTTSLQGTSAGTNDEATARKT